MGPKRIMSEGCWFLALKIIKPTSGKRYFPLQVISANRVFLARAVGVEVGWRSGGWLAMPLVAIVDLFRL